MQLTCVPHVNVHTTLFFKKSLLLCDPATGVLGNVFLEQQIVHWWMQRRGTVRKSLHSAVHPQSTSAPNKVPTRPSSLHALPSSSSASLLLPSTSRVRAPTWRSNTSTLLMMFHSWEPQTWGHDWCSNPHTSPHRHPASCTHGWEGSSPPLRV